MKRFLNWLINIILVWLLIVVIAFLLLPHFGGWRFEAILTGSMEPTLPVGGVVIIKPVDTSTIDRDDIITYRLGKSLITHRVIGVIVQSDENLFVTKGDANEDIDRSQIPESSVVGKAIASIPYFGYLAAFVKTRLGLLLTICLPGFVIIALELKNMWQIVLKPNTNEDKTEKDSITSH